MGISEMDMVEMVEMGEIVEMVWWKWWNGGMHMQCNGDWGIGHGETGNNNCKEQRATSKPQTRHDTTRQTGHQQCNACKKAES